MIDSFDFSLIMKSLVVVLFGFLFSGAFCSGWHYGDESHWPDTCRNGKSQSPINVDDQASVETKSYSKFVFNFYNKEFSARAKNNGHSVQVNLDVSSSPPTVTGGGLPKKYTLDHLHFHWKSEHELNGYRFPLEVHLVHYATDYGSLTEALKYKDGVAVLGVFYDLSPDDDDEFEPLTAVMKNITRSSNSIKLKDNTRVASFLPRDTAGFYRYNGSLTTPNCTEAVIWTLFTNTIHISHEQIKNFQSIQSEEGALKENYRSRQGLNERMVYKKVSPIPHGSAKSSFEKSFAFAVVLVILLKLL